MGKSWLSRQDSHVKDAKEAGVPGASLALAQTKAKAAAGKHYTMGIPAPSFRIGPYDHRTSIGAFSAPSSDAAADASSDEQVPDDSNEWYMLSVFCIFVVV